MERHKIADRLTELKQTTPHYYYSQEFLDLYRDNLKFADQAIADLIKHLKKNGLYEDSIIVVSGDHSFQENINFLNKIHLDPPSNKVYKLANELYKIGEHYKNYVLHCHVPLIIHTPHQKESIVSKTPITTSKIFSNTDDFLFTKGLKIKDLKSPKLTLSKTFVLPAFDHVHKPKPTKIDIWSILFG